MGHKLLKYDEDDKMTLSKMLRKQQKYTLKGVDDFSKHELETFWKTKTRFNQGKQDYLPLRFLCLSLTNETITNRVYESPEDTGKPLTPDEYVNLIDQAKVLGASSVILSGQGDPLQDSNLVQIVKHSSSKKMKTVIMTNGIAFGDYALCKSVHGMENVELARLLYDNDCSVVMEIDTMDPIEYSKVMGVRHKYGDMMMSFSTIDTHCFTQINTESDGKPSARMAINSKVLKNTWYELHNIRDIADKFPGQFVASFPISTPDGSQNYIFNPNVEAIKWLNDEFVSKLTDKPHILSVDGLNCGAWHYGVTIAIDGDIRICYAAPCDKAKTIGNVREAPLGDLLKIREQVYPTNLGNNAPCPARCNYNQEK